MSAPAFQKRKVIAYRNGPGAAVVCLGCWDSFSLDYKARTGCQASIGSIYYEGAEREVIAGRQCPVCKAHFGRRGHELAPDGQPWILREPNKPTPHAENGWQYHYARALTVPAARPLRWARWGVANALRGRATANTARKPGISRQLTQ